MTDSRPDDGRVDLRGLELTPDAKREDAIVAGVMSRLSRAPRAAVVSAPIELLRLRRALLAAAAVLAAIAAASVLQTRRQDASTDVIAGWTQSSHVPTNGELLAAYHGYRP
jgi:hypothetical protein